MAAVHGYTTAFTVSAALVGLAAIVAVVSIRGGRPEADAEALVLEPRNFEPAYAEAAS